MFGRIKIHRDFRDLSRCRIASIFLRLGREVGIASGQQISRGFVYAKIVDNI